MPNARGNGQQSHAGAMAPKAKKKLRDVKARPRSKSPTKGRGGKEVAQGGSGGSNNNNGGGDSKDGAAAPAAAADALAAALMAAEAGAEEETADILKERPLYAPGQYPCHERCSDCCFHYKACLRRNRCLRCVCRCLCGHISGWCSKEGRYLRISPRAVHLFVLVCFAEVLLCILTAATGSKLRGAGQLTVTVIDIDTSTVTATATSTDVQVLAVARQTAFTQLARRWCCSADVHLRAPRNG